MRQNLHSRLGGDVSDQAQVRRSLLAGTLALSGMGGIANSSGVSLATGAVFDISQTTAGASIEALGNTAAGQTGTVYLGAQTLTLTGALTTFGGVIADVGGIDNVTGGGLTLGPTAAGTETLTGVNTYTGATTIDAGTLALSGTGSIASSSVVADNGTFDISGLTNGGTTITTLSGSGGVTLGVNTLTLRERQFRQGRVQELDFGVMEAAGTIGREGIENTSPVRGVGVLPEPESEAEIVRGSRVVEIDKSGKVSLARPQFEAAPQPYLLLPGLRTLDQRVERARQPFLRDGPAARKLLFAHRLPFALPGVAVARPLRMQGLGRHIGAHQLEAVRVQSAAIVFEEITRGRSPQALLSRPQFDFVDRFREVRRGKRALGRRQG
jgi:autotransporter-associated beta strand protein